MRVMVIGQGGREHAICWKLRQSPLVREIYAAPGNAGIAEVADCVPIGVSDTIELADFAEQLKIDLTVVGPELPLTLGIVDEFQKRGLTIFGPTRLAAELEGSKAFSKEFMKRYAIPTADAVICSSESEALAALAKFGYRAVIKVDGLAGGKGVLLVHTRTEGEKHLRFLFESRKFGNAADRVLIEELLEGEEVSFIVVTDGTRVVPLATAKDYKRAFDGDEGPNTGGMGSHSPAIVLGGETGGEILRTIAIPTIQGMASEGRPYSGCLFIGLMLTADGPKVLEYNCRFGDPETQAQLLRLEDDLAPILLSVAQGTLSDTRLSWKKEAAVCIVVAADGYPGEFMNRQEIAIEPVDDPTVLFFHSGTSLEEGKLVNVAGRVVSVCAHAPSMSEALQKAYEAAPNVRFKGSRFRRDIGYRSLEVRGAAGE